MNDRILEHYLEEFQSGCDLDPAEAGSLFDALISSENQLLLTRVLLSWDEKQTTEDEIFSLASIMRNRMRRLTSRHPIMVDAVGTGGCSSKTFNISTAAAFIIAGAGVPVAKHGNRAATSSSGSSDVLAELGIDVDVDPADTERHLDTHGICFMFAPRFHALSPTLARARKAVGHPTIFNNLGPLCNPASVQHQVIGVWDKDLLEKTANVVARLGTERSWVVHGANGLDEVSLTGKTSVAEVNGETVTTFDVSADDFGVNSLKSDLPSNCTPAESSSIIRKLLGNEMHETDAEKLVLINAAAAIYVAGHASTLSDAYVIAENSVRSGNAVGKLDALVSRTDT